MEIYLRHEIHGRKIAHDFNEAKEDEKYGWQQIKKAEFFKVEKVNPEEDQERSNIIQAYMDKFGKMPHHKKSIDTIKKELEASNDTTTE